MARKSRKRSYGRPRSKKPWKRKTVSKDYGDATFQIEYIVKAKVFPPHHPGSKVGPDWKYLVKWFNYSETFNEWIPESNFENSDCVTAFWDSVAWEKRSRVLGKVVIPSEEYIRQSKREAEEINAQPVSIIINLRRLSSQIAPDLADLDSNLESTPPCLSPQGVAPAAKSPLPHNYLPSTLPSSPPVSFVKEPFSSRSVARDDNDCQSGVSTPRTQTDTRDPSDASRLDLPDGQGFGQAADELFSDFMEEWVDFDQTGQEDNGTHFTAPESQEWLLHLNGDEIIEAGHPDGQDKPEVVSKISDDLGPITSLVQIEGTTCPILFKDVKLGNADERPECLVHLLSSLGEEQSLFGILWHSCVQLSVQSMLDVADLPVSLDGWQPSGCFARMEQDIHDLGQGDGLHLLEKGKVWFFPSSYNPQYAFLVFFTHSKCIQAHIKVPKTLMCLSNQIAVTIMVKKEASRSGISYVGGN